MTGVRALSLAAALAVSFSLAPAWAAPTQKERAEGKALWTKGKRLTQQKKHDEAAEAYGAAVERDPKAQYQLDFARALAESGQLVAAREAALVVEATKEANAGRAKKAGGDLAESLKARIPSITVTLASERPPGATITLDGHEVAVGKEVPVDPGSHVVEGRAENAAPVTKQLDLVEGAHERVTIDLEARAIEKPVADEDDSGGGTMAPAVVAYVIGGAALAAGGILGGLAFNQTEYVVDLCGGNRCPTEHAGEVALAQDYGTASTVLFAVGGLGVAAGLVLTFTVGLSGDDDPEESKAGVMVRPYASPDGVGVVGTF